MLWKRTLYLEGDPRLMGLPYYTTPFKWWFGENENKWVVSKHTAILIISILSARGDAPRLSISSMRSKLGGRAAHRYLYRKKKKKERITI